MDILVKREVANRMPGPSQLESILESPEMAVRQVKFIELFFSLRTTLRGCGERNIQNPILHVIEY